MKLDNTKPIYLLGDHHGEYGKLFKKLKYFNISNCYILHVGDGGEGFKSAYKENDHNKRLNAKFAKRDICYLSIRGNHSDPSYFDGRVNLSNFKLLQDYTVLRHCNKSILCVGGAVSVDRCLREEGVSWWRGEGINMQLDKVPHVDIIVTHSSPTWNEPTSLAKIAKWVDIDARLVSDCTEERLAINKLIETSAAKKHFCGHMHIHSISEHEGCVSRIIDILELLELTYN
jgi:hypothetical protein